MKQRLVIAAHADDETIGCGGMISKYAEAGADIFVGVLTRDASDEQHQVRRDEAAAAWSTLGVARSDWVMMRSHPLTVGESSVDAVVGWLETFRPDLVFIPHPGEQDPDHAVVSRIVASAILRSGHFFRVLGYEVWTPILRPALFEDITDVMQRKMEAIQCFATQMRERDYASGAEGLNRFRGVTTGNGRFVEAFTLVQI